MLLFHDMEPFLPIKPSRNRLGVNVVRTLRVRCVPFTYIDGI